MRSTGLPWRIAIAVIIGLVAVSTTLGSRFKRYPTHGDPSTLMHAGSQETPAPASRPAAPAADSTSEAAGTDGEAAEGTDQEAAVDDEIGTLFSHRVLDVSGVRIDYIYIGEAFHNARGGLNTAGATEYRGLFDLAATFDLEALGGIEGGTFFVYGEDLHGRSATSNHVGDFQMLSNIDNPTNFTQVSEYWWQQELAEGAIWVKAGKQDANADFCALDLGGDFLNSSFGLIPNVPMPTYPHQGLGAALFATLGERLSMGAGFYDGGAIGTTWGFSTLGHFGCMSIAELKWDPQLAIFGGKPSAYRIGAWHHSGEWDSLDGSGTFADNQGWYAAFDQLLLLEEEDEEQGLGFFVQYGNAPDDRNAVENYFGVGLLYRGPIEGRDEDLCGVGLAHARFADELRMTDGMTYESAIETFYRAQVRPWAAVQPDLQFIANPGGNQKDALAVGVRFEIIL